MRQIIKIYAAEKFLIDRIHAVQGDTGRELEMIPMDFDAVSAVLWFERPDGTVYHYTCTVGTDGHLVSEIDQALTQAGTVQAQARCTDTNGVVTSFVFTIDVERNVDGTPTTEEYYAIAEAIEDCEEAVESIEEIQVEAESLPYTSAATATKVSSDPLKIKFGIPRGYPGTAYEWWGFRETMATLSATARIEYIGAAVGKTPMSLGSGGTVNLGDWGDFIDQLDNYPWMVKSDGTPDYRLQESDYTKKLDGTASDVSNTSYDGGAYAWLRKIYKYEHMDSGVRTVKFSFVPISGFHPVGFMNGTEELEGIWIPMFYGSEDSNGKMRSLAGMQPSYNKTTAQQYTAITANGTRHKFFGGAIAKTIEDLQIMLGKSADVQVTLGMGNMSGYDSTLSPTYGVKANAVVSGGRFYGTTDGRSLNKCFHSIVLQTWQQYMRDPYLLLVNGTYKISKDFTYDLTGDSYVDSGLSLPETGGWYYPHYYETIQGFGAVPVNNGGYLGSSTTGGCDGMYCNVSGVRVALRFGTCGDGRGDGARCVYLDAVAGGANWGVGAASVLCPPLGVSV